MGRVSGLQRRHPPRQAPVSSALLGLVAGNVRWTVAFQLPVTLLMVCPFRRLLKQ